MENSRTSKVFRNGRWLETNPYHIEINDIFVMFEDDGTLVDNCMNIARSKAFVDDNGVICINATIVKEV